MPSSEAGLRRAHSSPFLLAEKKFGRKWADIDLSGHPAILLRGETSKTEREYEAPVCSHLCNLLLEFRRISRDAWTGSTDAFENSQAFNLHLHLTGKQTTCSLTIQCQTFSEDWRGTAVQKSLRIACVIELRLCCCAKDWICATCKSYSDTHRL